MCNISKFFSSVNRSDIKYLCGVSIEIENSNAIKDRIIGICIIKYDLETMKCVGKLNTKICPNNPNISLKTYIKCGWVLNDLNGAPKYMDIVNKVIQLIGGSETAVVGYNLRSITIPFIYNETARCGFNIDFSENANKYVIDIKDFWEQTGVSFYNMKTMIQHCHLFDPLQYGIDLLTLSGQAKSSIIILEKMLGQGIKPETIYIYDNNGFVGYKRMRDTAFKDLNDTVQLVFTCGKYYGCPVSAVIKIDKGYIEWCISDKSGFSPSVKEKFKVYLK